MFLGRIPRAALLVLLAWLWVSGANQAWANERLVAVILTGDLPRYQTVQRAFLQQLSRTDVTIYTQTPNPDPLSLANSIRKAVAVGPELIVTYGAQAAMAAKKEARSVPVLFADVYGPVGLGLVDRLDATAQEMSGISADTPLRSLLGTLAGLGPANRTIAALYSSDDPGSEHQCNILVKIAPGFGFRVEAHDLQTASDLEPALAKLADLNPILFVSDSALVQKQVGRIMAYAAKRDLLVVSQAPGLCDRGALLTLEPNLEEQGIKLAGHVNRVLDGAAVSSLPVLVPHQVDLVLNLPIAKEHHLELSLPVLGRATRVVR